MFVGCGPALRIAKKIGMRFSSIDGFHFFHTIFQKTGLMFSTRDGNNHTLPLAWCICLVENKENWEYFGKRFRIFKGDKYVNLPGSAIIHDRQKGIPFFVNQFKPFFAGYADRFSGRSGSALFETQLQHAKTFFVSGRQFWI